ncbi:GGDEF domain-containing protein [Pseudohaliea sp.]|uniref:GGDEF domain-containing protein n=1 Tax=Pseudohaliea sp. TaxID=2740289 RepID=UPI0032EEB6CB
MNSSSPDGSDPTGLLDRLTLRQRLALGFSIGMMATLTVAVLFAAAFEFNARQAANLRRYNQDLTLVLQFSRAVGEMQLAASRYFSLGHGTAYEKVQSLYGEWADMQARCKREACLSIGKGAIFSDALDHLTTFHDSFLAVVENRRDILGSLESEFADAQSRLHDAAGTGDSGREFSLSDAAAMNSIHDHLTAVEAQLVAFFHSMNSDLLFSAESQLEEMRDHLDVLGAAGDTTAQGPVSADYRYILGVAYANIQRIRGYAYLVNVVMASEANEMHFLAETTAKRVLEDIDALQREIDHTRRFTALTLLASIVAVAVVALLLLRRVTLSITRPLRAVASAFRSLASGGEEPIRIRSYHEDEIGDLVTAARAFRDENTKVRQLLHDYEALNASLEAKVDARTEELRVKAVELDRLASTDNLTGVSNRRVLDTTLGRELARAERYRVTLGVVLFDIDLFKSINDTYGHINGDKVLVRLAAVVAGVLRNTDIFGRWGGEEFMVLCPQCTLSEVTEVAKKIRSAVASADFIPGRTVTISAGVATSAPGESGEALIARVDKALYLAKASGRNCVMTSPERPTSTGAGLR